ncbi:general secretion pathway protein GspK [Rhodoferax sp. AJA081-3]|uniref:general secretion pathway protein GspK n=1 Tax=Rhodoferax sp. AJA081-3 TaxID=2752316 RepID=UPI001ADFCDD4|nr:type II secretion system protein GspK [Rhodoferax sp. AJA081-3]QTN26115.1 general secretion pathway protein GspK [Rhodoferax sp. AJA081-3]
MLWVVTLLSVIAGNFAFSMRGEAQIARNLLSAAQAQAQADAGVYRAWYELMKPPTELNRWVGDGAAHDLSLADGVLRVSIQDESGKIDLNTASELLLVGLFRSAGMTQESAVALADSVQDWRDTDKLRRLHGAEEAEYVAAGKSYTPPNAPFETVDELQRVLGMTPQVFRLLEPALTVYSRQPGVNTAVAQRQALLAIPGVSPEMVEQFLVLRASMMASQQPAPVFVGAGAFASGPGGLPAYAVRSEVKMADGTAFVRQAVARITRDPKRPVVVLAWGEGESEQSSGTK